MKTNENRVQLSPTLFARDTTIGSGFWLSEQESIDTASTVVWETEVPALVNYLHDRFPDAFDDVIEDAMIENMLDAGERWESVTHAADGAGHTYRLAVTNGWLYRTVSYRWQGAQEIHNPATGETLVLQGHFLDNDIVAQSTVFVPSFVTE